MAISIICHLHFACIIHLYCIEYWCFTETSQRHNARLYTRLPSALQLCWPWHCFFFHWIPLFFASRYTLRSHTFDSLICLQLLLLSYSCNFFILFLFLSAFIHKLLTCWCLQFFSSVNKSWRTFFRPWAGVSFKCW